MTASGIRKKFRSLSTQGDMSRFGRNYLEVGLYTEIRFPEMGVRFIAVNDGVDSEDQSSNDFTPFRNIINEWYTEQNGYSTKKFSDGMFAGIRTK